MKFKTRGNRTIPVRGNPSIWRVAEWIINSWALTPEDCKEFPGFNKWERSSKIYQNFWYDKAAELMKKIQLNEFTGEDTHGD